MSNVATETDEFFNAWAIYRKVMVNNYMYHQEIYQAVSALLTEQWQTKPFTLLDLGCGDAYFLAQSLKRTAIQHYKGFDLSAPALLLASENMAPLNCKTDLVNIDFMEGLAQLTERFDIIFTSFALHHLTLAEKAKFFHLAHNVLAEKGMLVIIDTLREPNETLPDYLDHYCHWIQKDWQQLEEQELTAIYQHIRNNDIPETVDVLSGLAVEAGFSTAFSLYQVFWHQLLTFKKKTC